MRVSALFAALAASFALLWAEPTVMSEEYPPFNYTDDNGRLTGFSTEIVQEIKKRLDYNQPIEVLPWSRAYNLIKRKDNLVLFSMTRMESREALFKWVGPLVPNRSVFWGLEGKEYDIKTLGDARKLKIGTYKDDSDEIFLKEEKFPHLQSVIKDELNVKKLVAGKIDLWIAGDPAGMITAKKMGLGDKVKRVFIARETQMYIAFSKNTPDEEIARWQEELDRLKSGGFYEQVWNNYFK